MNLKEFLAQNKIIKESALATLMWPDKKNQAKVFSNKINEIATGKNGSKQRITENDEARAKVVLLQVADKIKDYAGGATILTDTVETPVDLPIKKIVPIKKEAEKEPTMAELLRQMAKERK